MKYFTTKDNFKEIIEHKLGIVDSLEQISTGWTNFVFKVQHNDNNYIFRFPRNNFFSEVLDKEVKFSTFIKNKLSLKTPELNLLFDNSRPFTMHQEIKGNTMTSLYKQLNKNDKERIASQISDFIYELQQVDISKFEYKLSTTSSFLKGLAKVDDQEYDYSKLNPLIELESKKLTLSHADLNPGNILLDGNNNVCAILDFAFVSLSSDINDMSRLIGRLDSDFYPIMLNAYNKRFSTNIDTKDIDALIKVWNHVEYHYMIYMKNHHPEIDF